LSGVVDSLDQNIFFSDGGAPQTNVTRLLIGLGEGEWSVGVGLEYGFCVCVELSKYQMAEIAKVKSGRKHGGVCWEFNGRGVLCETKRFWVGSPGSAAFLGL
jgi:hypothetical protein